MLAARPFARHGKVQRELEIDWGPQVPILHRSLLPNWKDISSCRGSIF